MGGGGGREGGEGEGGYMSGSRICVNICMGVRGYQARSGGEREVDVPDVDSSR